MKLIRKHAFTLSGMLIGALGGFIYWKFIGCATGSCPITSNPIHSTLYGALLGTLFMNIMKDFKTTKS